MFENYLLSISCNSCFSTFRRSCFTFSITYDLLRPSKRFSSICIFSCSIFESMFLTQFLLMWDLMQNYAFFIIDVYLRSILVKKRRTFRWYTHFSYQSSNSGKTVASLTNDFSFQLKILSLFCRSLFFRKVANPLRRRVSQ